MMPSLSARFSRALRALENERDLQPLVQLFADDAEVFSPMLNHPLRGSDGVRSFWRHHLDTFSEVKSEFVCFVDGRENSAIEWISHAKMQDGRLIEYGGITLLEAQDERITRMYAYFDPRALLAPRRKPTPIRRRPELPNEKTA